MDARYAANEKPTNLDFFTRAFVYGVVTYAFTFAIYLLLKQPFALIDFKAAQTNLVLTQRVGIEIISATFVGFVLGIGWVFASNHKWMTIFLQFIRATKRYGDEDVWVKGRLMSDDRKMARDGYSRQPQVLSEGYQRKGGLNPPTSQIVTRPPPPAAMRPAADTTAPAPATPRRS
jgi:hypothetical protein